MRARKPDVLFCLRFVPPRVRLVNDYLLLHVYYLKLTIIIQMNNYDHR